mmetsp:Transcript_76798/g.183984  ORF Transcript_76798/g.183984 Transcript_76798/m.183984 type:complete len:231 (+) Transcript_76798:1044-1736(+)
MVHQRHQGEQGGPEPELGAVPVRVPRPRDLGRVILREVTVHWREAVVDNHHRPPLVIEVGIPPIALEAVAHRQTRQGVGAHHEVLRVLPLLHLDTVGAKALEAESGQRLVAVLVRPALVDLGVHRRKLLHRKLHRVIVRPKLVEAVGHDPPVQAVLDEVRGDLGADELLQKLVLAAFRHLDVQGVVHVVLLEDCPRLHVRHRHEVRVGLGQRGARVQPVVGQINHLLVEI